ncbi:MAG: NAD-dependent epimerase/dehydratase family protein [Paracoccus sp. (in: a-proteobacteria)]|nr:NAD-dependent epimerase/dehydratase family protein [Paracoccus sp. (in: a-proteobacteria)]
MKWLITGGAGFIGANLIRAILGGTNGAARGGAEREGAPQIVVLDNFSASTFDEFRRPAPLDAAQIIAPAAPVWQDGRRLGVIGGDIRDTDTALRATDGADIIVHLAANTGVQPSVANPRLDCEQNVIGTLNLLEGARAGGAGRFVFASSGAPAGLCAPPITERIAPRPVSPYGASKLAGEAYCSAYAAAFSVPTVALRFSNVYGPGSWRKGSVVAEFIRKAMAGETITINGDGSQTRDFIHVDDLTRAIILAATMPGLSGELFQIATGRETSVNELLAMLTPEFRAAGLPEITTTRAGRSAADVMRNFADASKAAEMLGWRPVIGLEGGLRETVSWFLANRAR